MLLKIYIFSLYGYFNLSQTTGGEQSGKKEAKDGGECSVFPLTSFRPGSGTGTSEHNLRTDGAPNSLTRMALISRQPVAIMSVGYDDAQTHTHIHTTSWTLDTLLQD